MPKETFYNLDDDKRQRIVEAAIDEFAEYSYNEAKLSRIIKSANIPRGSFYQYFEDKMDLYKYLYSQIVSKKIEYFGDDINNPTEMPFIELFRTLYKSGVQFAADNPRFIRMTRFLMSDRSTHVFKEILGDSYLLGKEYYKSYIETDKKHGRIRQDVDSDILADFILDTTTTIAFNELSSGEELDLNHMFQRMEQMLLILQKGIE